MPLKTYNLPPYYDDFDQTKNYMRILFRPGYSVQARELTQLQTALQAQIDRFGRHTFKEGSPVIGGQASLDTQYAFIKLESSFVDGVTYNADLFAPAALGRELTGATNGVKATVLEVVPATDIDPLTIYVKYTKAATGTGGNSSVQLFNPTEILTWTEQGGTSRKFKVKVATQLPVGYGTRVSVNEGVFFVNGNFVYTPAESVIISKYANRPSARVVYVVSESVVTQAEDATLNDNALGSPNEAAPGAHRYQISLTLTVQPAAFANRDEDNIIQLMVVQDGRVVQQTRTEYSELGDILAQRTFEESGNYTVRPFQINVREYYNSGTNGGLYTAAQINALYDSISTDAAAETYGKARLAVGLEPAVAYVNGYRIETLDTKYVEVEKARDQAYLNAASILCNLGNYIRVNTVVGFPDINNFSQLELRGGTGSTIIGYARARGFALDSGSTYRLYLFDIQMSGSNPLSDVNFVRQTVSGTAGYSTFSATIADVDATLYETNANSLLFRLPVNAVKSLRTSDNLIDTLYYVKKKYDNRSVSSSTVTIAASTDEIFYSTTASDYVAVNASGAIVTISGVSLGSGGSSVILTFSGYSSGAVDVVAPSRRNLREKIKTYTQNVNVAITTPNSTPGNYDSLGITDLVSVSGIYMSASGSTPATTSDTNVTDRYFVDNGQRENFYDMARIQLKPGASAPTGRLLIVLNHFTHQPGDYFTVDSYLGIDYDLIPSFQSSKGLVQLRDVLDFRPTIGAGSSFTGTGGSVVSMVAPNNIVTSDIQYYLPRIDKVYVDKKGNFGVAKGISSLQPIAPEDPKDAMVLYVVALGAYTFGLNDIIPTVVDNKRYTMRDIGKLEKRIAKLEYYTSLSLLEKDTAGKQIFDGAAVRYKNGFIADAFFGHNIGAVTHPDYRCSIDKNAGKLRPKFYSDNIKLNWDPAQSSGVRKTGPLLTLNYTQAIAIDQPYASESEYVNPYNVFSWRGRLKLSPDTDEWKETQRKPDVIIDQTGAYDSLVYMNDESANGTVWNDWQVTWTGVTQYGNSSTSSTVIENRPGYVYTVDVATTTPAWQDQVLSRTGVRTITVPDVTTHAGTDRVVETNIVPFIRSRKIYFSAVGMKPNTRVYAFFDGQSLANYVRTETTFVEYASRTDVTNYLDASAHPDGAGELKTDAAGSLVGSFVIPNTSTFKIKTGTRIFRLTDSSTNSNSGVITSAEAEYRATGMVDVVEGSVITTRGVKTERITVTDTKTDTKYWSNTSHSYSYTPPWTGTILGGPVTGPSTSVPEVKVTPPVTTVSTDSVRKEPFLLWPIESYLPGGALNPFGFPGTNTDTTAIHDTGGNDFTDIDIYNPGNILCPPPVNLPESTLTPAEENPTAELSPWTPDAAVPPDVEIKTYANPDATPTITTIAQSDYPVDWAYAQWQNDTLDCYVDPLAQTFSIDTNGGMFATSIGLYFAEKDENIPVTVQLRIVENGMPTSRVVPFSECTLAASSVLVSDNATAPTNFTFEAPVHLQQGVEYCFVIMANSDKYKVWVSNVGNYDVTNPSFAITKQPYNGVMFKSQNASTWSPEQTKDIKFVLRRAAFQQSGSAVFTEVDIPPVQLGSDPVYTNGTTTVRVYHPDHGHFVGSKVTLSGIAATSGSALNGVPITQLNADHTLTAVEADWYSFTVATTASATGFAGGADVYATENRAFDVFQPIIQQIVVPDTDLTYQARVTSGKSLAGTETPHIVSALQDVHPNDNNYMARPQVVLSPVNRSFLSTGSRSFVLSGNFTTTRNNLSPVIDLERLSLVTISNRIDNPSSGVSSGYNQVANYVAETSAIGGSALAKYITRKVELNDPATAMKIYILANRPAASDIKMYYKVLPKGSDANFDTLGWTLVAPDASIPTTDDINNFSEVEYSVTEAALSLSEYTAFAIKIVLVSENSSTVPTIRDFRAIAVT